MADADAIENVMGEEKPAEILEEENMAHKIGRENGNPIRNVLDLSRCNSSDPLNYWVCVQIVLFVHRGHTFVFYCKFAMEETSLILKNNKRK